MRNNFNTLSSQEETSVNYKKKVAAATLAVTGLFSVGCSSEGSASGGGGLFNSSREVIAGDDCSEVQNVYSVGTYSPTGSNRYEPFPDGTPDPDGVALPDGSWNNDNTQGTLVDVETFSQAQTDQLKASYGMKVEQINSEKKDYDQPTYQNGFIVLYGKELGDVATSSPEDGAVDDEDLQVCVFARSNQGDVSRSQFAR